MATYTLTANNDNLVGTTANDTFNATYDAAVTDTFSANDFLNGRAGIDTLYISHLLDVAITPPDSLWTNLSNIEKIVIQTTGNGAQTITTGVNFQAAFGLSGVNLISETTGAGAINLTMASFKGMATLKTTSTDGAQTIVTGSGATAVTGAISGAGALNIKGIGLNTVFATTTGAGAQTIGDSNGNGRNLDMVIAESAGGAQTITSTSENTVVVVATSAAGIQIINTGSGDDIVTASTSSGLNTIGTGIGNDKITVLTMSSGNYNINAGVGDDIINSGAGNDTLRGGMGNDTLNGGAGVDSMSGGDGSDFYYVDIATDIVIEANPIADTGGIDLVYSSLTGYVLPDNVENGRIMSMELANMTGNSLDNNIMGRFGNNIIRGGAGDDSIHGFMGQDTLIGGLGNDVLYGGPEQDSLAGGFGSDSLYGGMGQDTLTGGLGNDSFYFNSLLDMNVNELLTDTITGGQDKIDLSALDANTATTLDDAFTGFIGSGAKFTAPGQLMLANSTLYGNTDADSAAEFTIQLTGITVLTISDFIL
jgi:Ca2+-binding RTX toxin-like protein